MVGSYSNKTESNPLNWSTAHSIEAISPILCLISCSKQRLTLDLWRNTAKQECLIALQP